MNNPKVSIVAIYNNQEENLKKFVSSVLNQTFSDIEIIFVNADVIDNSVINILLEASKKDNRVKLINLPNNTDSEFAKSSAIDVASGDYICCLNVENELSDDFVQNIYYENLKINKNKIYIENGKVYKREFIENNTDIDSVIELKVKQEMSKVMDIIAKNNQNNENNFDKFSKNVDNIVSGKVYEVLVRASQLEKLVYDKTNEIKSETWQIIQNTNSNQNENNKQIYSDISKVYDFVNSEINKKGCEINSVYEEISKNYRYTEKINDEAKQTIFNEVSKLYSKIDELSKEQEIRYSTLQRQVEVLSEKLEAINVVTNSGTIENAEKLANARELEKTLKENIDNLYSFINKNNAKFYDELSTLYKEVNEKLNR